MKEKAINPGYTNQIFVVGFPTTKGNNVEIIGGNKKQFVKFEFDPNVSNNYISVKTTSLYVEKSDNGDKEVPIITDISRYRLVKDHDFTFEELYPILQTSTKRLIRYFQEDDKIRSNNRQLPYCPQLHDVQTQLEDLAKKVNQKAYILLTS